MIQLHLVKAGPKTEIFERLDNKLFLTSLPHGQPTSVVCEHKKAISLLVTSKQSGGGFFREMKKRKDRNVPKKKLYSSAFRFKMSKYESEEPLGQFGTLLFLGVL